MLQYRNCVRQVMVLRHRHTSQEFPLFLGETSDRTPKPASC
jgi:hypothetical protein